MDRVQKRGREDQGFCGVPMGAAGGPGHGGTTGMTGGQVPDASEKGGAGFPSSYLSCWKDRVSL